MAQYVVIKKKDHVATLIATKVNRPRAKRKLQRTYGGQRTY